MTLKELRAKCKRQSDYIITLFVTNEISLLLTWFLMNRRITPNQVTLASILCGFGCATCYAYGKFLVGSLLLFFSHILDCTDGNLARAKSNFSPVGKWLDMAGDRITEALIFAGVSVYFLRAESSESWAFLSLINAILLSFYYYIVDIGLAIGLSKSLQNIGGMKFRDVSIKWGLLEPVIYGFILLAPFGFLKAQLIVVLIFSLLGIAYQVSKQFNFQRIIVGKSISGESAKNLSETL